MDFRTEWSSWLMVLLMIGIAAIINPWMTPDTWTARSVLVYAVKLIAYPFITTAVATIPVLIVCYFIKVEPDLDYSMRTAFVYMLFLLVLFFVGG